MPADALQIDAPLSAIPYGEQWVGAWAIQESHGDALLAMLSGLSVSLHLQQQQQAKVVAGDSGSRLTLQVSPQGIAQVNLTNTLMKQRASMSNNTSTVEARQLLRAAAQDPEVKGVVLFIDSPGGTVAGTADLAAEVNRTKARKPVYAYIEDLGASAAYWVASQATKVFTNQTGIVGSIGTYMQVIDYRRAADQLGMTVHVIRAGNMKGAGTPGTEITPEQLADFQRLVNALNDQFLSGVAAGRNLPLETVRGLATGQTWVGQEAVTQKLVDRVASAEDVFQELAQLTSAATKPQKGKSMSQDNATAVAADNKPQAATIADLEQHLPKASGDFKIAQLKQGATLTQALSAYAVSLEQRCETLQQEVDNTKAAAAKPGHAAQAEGKTSSGSSDAIAAWNEAVGEKMKSGLRKSQAVAACVKESRDLYAAYLAASNAR